LLCPEAFSWHPIEFCFELLDKKKYNRFSDKDAKDQDQFRNINEINIRAELPGTGSRDYKFSEFCHYLRESFLPQFYHLINGYCVLFGRKFSKRVLLKF
jgi:hypothetical protein